MLPEWVKENLDDMDPEDRSRFLLRLTVLNPGTKEDQLLLEALKTYCALKNEACNNRKKGLVSAALDDERILEIIYQRLPMEYRW